MAQSRLFDEVGVEVMVFLADQPEETYLDIKENGVLEIPSGIKPSGFHLVLGMPRESRVLLVQRNVGATSGFYHETALSLLDKSKDDYEVWVMFDPINVRREGKNVWTEWHRTAPNRIDCWWLGIDGHTALFQIGVTTADKGRTFRVIGDRRWEGRLFNCPSREIVGKPDDPRWGAFSVRKNILEHPDFQKFLRNANLLPWTGTNEELEPRLDRVSEPTPELGSAVADWYALFAGRNGQGIARAKLRLRTFPLLRREKKTIDSLAVLAALPWVRQIDREKGTIEFDAWVHGEELQIEPGPDGCKRLWRNDRLVFASVQRVWGTKRGAPPKLLSVRRPL